MSPTGTYFYHWRNSILTIRLKANLFSTDLNSFQTVHNGDGVDWDTIWGISVMEKIKLFILVQGEKWHWNNQPYYLKHLLTKIPNCIFRPTLRCCALQMLVEKCFFHIFGVKTKKQEKARKLRQNLPPNFH